MKVLSAAPIATPEACRPSATASPCCPARSRSIGARAAAGTLRNGDTIDRAEADRILASLLETEYAPPVAKRFGGLRQHVFDATTSVTYDAGAATLNDRWAGALDSGDIAGAAKLLRCTRVTAGGRRRAGLVRRRADEARLLRYGDYGEAIAAKSGAADEDVRAYQRQLASLGFYRAAIDGIAGTLTRAAIRTFQRQHGLAVDGIVGPATRAALVRAVEARIAAKAVAGTAIGGMAAGALASLSGTDAPGAGELLFTIGMVGVAALVLTIIAWTAWRYRGLILRRRTQA